MKPEEIKKLIGDEKKDKKQLFTELELLNEKVIKSGAADTSKQQNTSTAIAIKLQ